MYKSLLWITASCMGLVLTAQNLPDQWTLNEAEHRLIQGGKWDTDIYQTDVIHSMEIVFVSNNFWTQLTTNYNSATDLSATVIIDGITYEQVGVRFKGQTSYMMTNGEEKKSFNITMDSFIDGQDHDGFSTFNLNNCFDDPSFMKEFLYLYHIRNHVPAARASYVHLTINGESWGIYPCVEGLDGTYIKDWFLSNDGSRWRADEPGTGFGGGGGGGPQWGDGTAALNWLGSDQTEYEQYYTLKNSGQTDPWSDLINTCNVLNNTPNDQLTTLLPEVLDIDRTLWFLACENAFGDDDSYIYKGKMDYYLYYEAETGRITPLEYDGNSILVDESMNWSPFYHATDVDYPLLFEMLAIPEWRQRYLAHLRTILNSSMDETLNAQLIEQYSSMIDAEVQADTKKLYSYNQFTSGVNNLEDDIQTRRDFIYANSEVNTTGAVFGEVKMISNEGEWINPVANEAVQVTAEVSSSEGLNAVWLYYSNELVGNFTIIQMYDDGVHGDGAASDGTFGAEIPGMPLGTIVRFYIEAKENNTAQTATYIPEGAEHDVFYYIISVSWALSSDIVINEVMALNNTGVLIDEVGEEEDWIELYNKGTQTVDLTGYFVTDNALNIDKWQIPDGTLIQPNEYLILWADEDSINGGLHTNFKLSSSGEAISLINASVEIADQVAFGEQQENMGYARVPNGTGPFIIQGHTFAANNDYVSVAEVLSNGVVRVFPNPTADKLNIICEGRIQGVQIYNLQGVLIENRSINNNIVDVSSLSGGMYFMSVFTDHGAMPAISFVKN
jgi:hypothetical protein